MFNLAENDINYFVDQVWTIANLKYYWFMQANITMFLKSVILDWYQYKLKNKNKFVMEKKPSIDTWCKTLTAH